MTDPIVIEHEGRPTHVVLAWEDWQRLREAAENMDNLAAIAAVRADANQDRIPLEVARRLWRANTRSRCKMAALSGVGRSVRRLS